MAKQIKFTIGGFFGGYNTIEIFIDGSTVRCKAARISYNKEAWQKFDKLEGKLVEVSDSWLAELDALEIFSWQEKYDCLPKYPDDFIWWNLTFEDNGKIYRGQGTNTAHKNWSRFMDWLGAIFKEKDRWVDI